MNILKELLMLLVSWVVYCAGHIASIVTEVTDRFGYHEACCIWYRYYSRCMQYSNTLQSRYAERYVRYWPWSQ